MKTRFCKFLNQKSLEKKENLSGVMVDQHEALADTTELTNMVYLVRSTGIQTVNPWISKEQHWILHQD